MRQWCNLAMADFQIKRAQKKTILYGQDDDVVVDFKMSTACHLHPHANCENSSASYLEVHSRAEVIRKQSNGVPHKLFSLHLHLDLQLLPLHSRT